MSRVTPPTGYTWNSYIESQADAAIPQTMANRRLVKRNVKLGQIAQVERKAGGNIASPSYRQYNTYTSPGTYAPTVPRPFTK